ncbi:SagB/ThcOx family dehydrogenase [Lentilactobacillus parafarraginis]|jgi:SagB-type dehydrogenase family enzyme|uniref:SagB-type dehydrogenase domain protein n=2 Tax=Lentilactobacillus parafarraginis TaxID=390842 RepID=A0A0R1YAH9_9LACO|nr:nitroreductase family protein [Lentilactobacillus parafarraginis]KRM39456.1 hypothetical protein FD47_GL000203 [Lentilactobacillus parafarraginis DSM 18390 = JCM 14109]TLQ17036.1 SagB/ThcOx family dehydrogenase [Lentilactobacillus parafarraginis]
MSNYPWKNAYRFPVGNDLLKTVFQFHNKTVWINYQNNIRVPSAELENWINENSGNESDYRPESWIKKIKLTSTFKPNNIGSIRDFSFKQLSLCMVSKLIIKSFGKNENNFSRRYPSAGGLYTVIPLLYVFNSAGEIESGIYMIDSVKFELLKIVPSIEQNVPLKDSITISQDDSKIPSVYCIGYAINIPASVVKYGLRGYRHALMEVGLMAQAFRESCHELNLGEYCSSSFDDFPLTYESGLNVRDSPICLIQWFGGKKDVIKSE